MVYDTRFAEAYRFLRGVRCLRKNSNRAIRRMISQMNYKSELFYLPEKNYWTFVFSRTTLNNGDAYLWEFRYTAAKNTGFPIKIIKYVQSQAYVIPETMLINCECGALVPQIRRKRITLRSMGPEHFCYRCVKSSYDMFTEGEEVITSKAILKNLFKEIDHRRIE